MNNLTCIRSITAPQKCTKQFLEINVSALQAQQLKSSSVLITKNPGLITQYLGSYRNVIHNLTKMRFISNATEARNDSRAFDLHTRGAATCVTFLV